MALEGRFPVYIEQSNRITNLSPVKSRRRRSRGGCQGVKGLQRVELGQRLSQGIQGPPWHIVRSPVACGRGFAPADGCDCDCLAWHTRAHGR